MLLDWGRRLYAWAWGLAAFILVLLALYASLGRYYIGYLSQFQQELVADVEQRTGLDVELDTLRGSWSGLSPVVHLHNLQIKAADQSALSLDQADIKLNLLSGLINRQFIVSDIAVQNLQMHFWQREQGDWSFAGIVLGAGNRRADNLFSSLLGLREVKLRDTRALLHYRDQEQAVFWSERLDLEGDGHFRRLTTTFGVGESRPANLIAEARGDPRDTSFQADAFVRLDDSRFETLAPLFGELSELADGTASGDLWLQWRSSGDTTFQAQLQIPQLAVGAFWQQPSQQVENIKAQVGGVLRDGRWQFWLPQLQAHWQQQDLRFDHMRIEQVGPTANLLRVSLPTLNIANTHQLLANTDLLPESVKDVLQKLSPTGQLQKLRVVIPLRPGDQDKFSIDSEVHDVATHAWHGAPGITGANGYVEVVGARGTVVLDSPQLGLDFPGLYPGTLQVADFQAALNWEVNGEGVQLISGPMHFTDHGAQLGALLALDLPHGDNHDDPTMTLSVGISQGNARDHKKYIPLNLPEDFRNWLDRSLLSGKIDSGAFVYRGSLLPDAHRDRTVQLYFDVSEADLDYHPDWPELQKVSALVEIDDGVTRVKADAAQLYSHSRLTTADVQVASVRGETRLLVDARAEMPLSEALLAVTRTPVRQQLGSALDGWRAKGEASADLHLDIPLQSGARAAEVAVTATIRQGSLFLDPYDLSFQQLQGPLHFDTTRGLSSKGLKGRFFNKPMTVEIRQGKAQPLLVDIDAQVAATDLRNWLQQPVLDFIEGQSAFHAQVEVGGDTALLRAESDLSGMALTVPAPLSKEASEKRSLAMTLPLNSSDPVLHMRLEGMGVFRLRLGGGDSFGGASLSLGPTDSASIEPGHFLVSGQLPAASFDPWQAALDRYLESASRYAQKNGGGGESIAIRIDNLFIKDMFAFDRHFEQLMVNAHNGQYGNRPWTILLNNPMLRGSLQLPEENSDQVLRARLVHLRLPSFDADEDSAGEEQKSVLADVDPRQLVDIDVDIEHLYFGEEDWGALGFNLRSDSAGAHFNGLRGKMRGLAVDGQGEPAVLHWLRSETGDTSHFQGSLYIDEIGDVLQRWQVPRMMESRSGRLGVDFQWPGQPDLMSPLTLTGDLDMRFDKGRLLEAPEIASGTLRMVAIFNFANILRRLQLDFRDVFKRGIHYDHVDGAMHFQDGIMSMSQPLVVKGPSSEFRMSGYLDFHTDMTDMELVATLPVRTNLPWIAALISGLPVAAGVFIASKLFEEQMDKYSSAVYRVSGPWQQPELKFRRLFDDKLSDSPSVPANGGEEAVETADPGAEGVEQQP